MKAPKRIIELKNTIEGLFRSLDKVEKRISKLEDRIDKFIQSEQQKEKQMKREDNLRNLWENIKWTNICI